eukprot:1790519-Pyramimonas_sp.AAC.1
MPSFQTLSLLRPRILFVKKTGNSRRRKRKEKVMVRLSSVSLGKIDVSDSVPLSVMSNIAFISRLELFVVISPIVLVVLELML